MDSFNCFSLNFSGGDVGGAYPEGDFSDANDFSLASYAEGAGKLWGQPSAASISVGPHLGGWLGVAEVGGILSASFTQGVSQGSSCRGTP